MIPEVAAFAQVSVVIVLLAGSLATIGVTTTRAIMRMRRPELPPARQQADERLERLQQSVDVIALEVERMAEAQRFNAKLLAGQEDASPLTLRQ